MANGGWAGSTRRDRLPPDWHRLRALTYRRAGGRCQWLDDNGQRCTTVTPLNKTNGIPGGHADHIVRDAGDGLDNLRWLCGPHHRTKSSQEGHEAAAANRDRGRHPSQTNPGARAYTPRHHPLPPP